MSSSLMMSCLMFSTTKSLWGSMDKLSTGWCLMSVAKSVCATLSANVLLPCIGCLLGGLSSVLIGGGGGGGGGAGFSCRVLSAVRSSSNCILLSSLSIWSCC